MKIAKVVGIIVLGPILGAVFGCLVGVLLLPPVADPTMRAPGDGILIAMCALVGVILCTVVALVLAAKVWWRSDAANKA
jgi:hypothetical protein